MATHTLLPELGTVHWGYLDASLNPVLSIDDGDIVTVHSVSGSIEETPYDHYTICPELKAIHQTLMPDLGPHILTGPIRIRGAMPNDLLKIDILDIQLRDNWGFNIIRPGKGALPGDFSHPRTMHFAIDRKAGIITPPWGGRLAAKPFFGLIATAPRREEGRRSSIIPDYFGGNIDNKELGAGSTLYLPVSVEGALVSIGDGHAAQGDGEVCLTAVETGLTGTFRFSVIKAAEAPVPFAETATHLIAMGFDENLELAVQKALRNAIKLIGYRTGLSAENAFSLCSIAADARITQLVNVRKGSHIMIPKSVLPDAAVWVKMP